VSRSMDGKLKSLQIRIKAKRDRLKGVCLKSFLKRRIQRKG